MELDDLIFEIMDSEDVDFATASLLAIEFIEEQYAAIVAAWDSQCQREQASNRHSTTQQ